ncbi:MAG: hypothetical protein M0R05_00545 [Bacilli bacterium]|nr:hypothetical protein [Bacilli bacterium]MDD4076460.1 hypothetical protein [Bacilli bacterium]MDD4388255.1 hypothetical protein [Bacilli bacterium]
MNFNDLSRIINQALNIYSNINRPYYNHPPAGSPVNQSSSWKSNTSSETPVYPAQGRPKHYYYLDKIKAFLYKEI